MIQFLEDSLGKGKPAISSKEKEELEKLRKQY
jgi:hypothetical protein